MAKTKYIKVDKNYFYNPISLINHYIQELAKVMFADDDCPPIFITSLKDDGDIDEIVITVEHCGVSFTETIFPVKGNDTTSLQTTLEYLYNRTI